MVEGLTMSQFSFQIPKPLQENYVRKRPARVTAGSHHDITSSAMSRPLEPGEGMKIYLDLVKICFKGYLVGQHSCEDI